HRTAAARLSGRSRRHLRASPWLAHQSSSTASTDCTATTGGGSGAEAPGDSLTRRASVAQGISCRAGPANAPPQDRAAAACYAARKRWPEAKVTPVQANPVRIVPNVQRNGACDHAATSASMLSHCSGVEVPALRYRLGSNSKDIDCRKLWFSGQAVPQIDGETNVAGPQ